MSDTDDKDSKTEAPSDKKVRDAVEKGNIPFSREAPMFASILGILLALTFAARSTTNSLTEKLSLFINRPQDFRLESGPDATALMQAVALEVGQFLIPIIVILAACSLSASIFQNVPSLVSERIRPQWNRISPMAGWKRIFGLPGLVEFSKSLFKFGTVTLVSLLLLRSEQYKVFNAMFTDPSLLPELMLTMAMRLVSAIAIATIVLVAADLLWARFKWRNDLKMTKQEVKEEYKQMEGDPMVKARMRSLAQDRSRKRMLAAVPKATFVIANPTHFAIAMRYERSEASAPIVVAKGKDLIALKIREIAEKSGVPVIEDKPLARSMYDHVEIDRMIPPDFYKAVAQILFYILTRSK
ncbi:flagellar biosynthesis protein FlhB [Microvirga sp. 3-52]|jgi:flagellar biosynthesis protein FlhB|uniref:flagellar biosynthesis protein FlhB n=1 Tax=Microvirga sp. 3-52 TaxID=2792425 RepID=UPI001ACA31C1|nr:flagellar biosynthesis protein FlhB [Microvirga sp. 3-52]MBO1904416.1 flagellar biosynthesis protein FlhB [Microvirga sp. 3-52]MBS7451414.1 flagellar biosynthesis protein FlhB [Microvirga sp. 3-52]